MRRFSFRQPFLSLSAMLLMLAHQACSQTDSTRTFVWQPTGCDSTLVVDTLRAFDLAMPFYPDDTLAVDATAPVRVFAVVIDRLGKTRWAGLSVGIDEKPKLDSAASPPGWERLLLTGIEQIYLRALVDQPEYLYQRWEPLLSGTRSQFLVKRDSLLDSLRRVFPNFTVRILNDLRSAGTQARFLRRGSSNAPLSQHQFGLATDVGIVSKGKLLSGYSTYARIGRLSTHYGITWGGDFVGFVDPNHIQALHNSAAMVRQFPELRFEFEPYRRHYLRRVNLKISQGKEDEVQDTEELLEVLNQQRQRQPCLCDSALAERPVLLTPVQDQLKSTGYQPGTDILLMGDLTTQTITATRGAARLTYRLGKWR
ncbi:MAG: M15 family metallopeptidase [Cytophagaceae bacterium]|nr:M15 family metallopeptidase [Cytophagaceae bacterium]